MGESNPPSDVNIDGILKNLLLTENPWFSVDENKLTVKVMTKVESEILLNTKNIGNKDVTTSDKTCYNTNTRTML